MIGILSEGGEVGRDKMILGFTKKFCLKNRETAMNDFKRKIWSDLHFKKIIMAPVWRTNGEMPVNNPYCHGLGNRLWQFRKDCACADGGKRMDLEDIWEMRLIGLGNNWVYRGLHIEV